MILFVNAMARPARPDAERLAVVAAAEQWPNASPDAAAAKIARRVVAMIADAMDGEEPLAAALAMAAATLAADPIALLATDEQIDTAALVRTARLVRFEARGCRHLPEREWPAERRTIAAAVARTLAGRYARYIRAARADFSATTVFLQNQLGESVSK